ncbi:MAG TPA: PfkB family carbohydrate kinase [Candidatus Limnocylindrales bacterium]|nr:PfkB family carbohydrate kinase [Candidatus Limnocylindrales bacterium]
MDPRPTVLVVGAATRDIDDADPRGWRLGGGVSYASMAAARMGAKVRALIGVEAEAGGASELDVLRAAGVDVRLVPLERGPVFHNLQTDEGRVQMLHQSSDPVPAAALPDDWRATPTVMLTPVAAELGLDWATALPHDTFVALAWQGLLRYLKAGTPVTGLPLTVSALVARADVLALSAEDATVDSPQLRDLLREGQRLLLTHGEYGSAELQLSNGRIHGHVMPPLPRREPIDTTGAGDVFFASWLIARSLHPDLARPGDARALAAASAMASLSLTISSLVDLPDQGDLCDVLVKLRDRQLR